MTDLFLSQILQVSDPILFQNITFMIAGISSALYFIHALSQLWYVLCYACSKDDGWILELVAITLSGNGLHQRLPQQFPRKYNPPSILCVFVSVLKNRCVWLMHMNTPCDVPDSALSKQWNFYPHLGSSHSLSPATFNFVKACHLTAAEEL